MADVVHLLVNPASRRGAADSLKVRAQLEASGRRVELISAEDAIDVSPAIRRADPEHVVAVGGDGLIHHALPALVESRTPMGIVPSGTGNDFARALGLPKRRAKAVERALGGSTPVDLLRVEWEDGTETLAASAVTAGFSGKVTATANARSFPKGQLKYTAASLSELSRLEPFDLSLTCFDEANGSTATSNGGCSFFAVANTRFFGGGMAIAPKALATDGRLHLTNVAAVAAWKLALVLPTVFVGQHVRHPAVTEISGSSVELHHGQDVWADGERIGYGPIKVTVVPAALFVCAF